jgi:hypothetical protein
MIYIYGGAILLAIFLAAGAFYFTNSPGQPAKPPESIKPYGYICMEISNDDPPRCLKWISVYKPR